MLEVMLKMIFWNGITDGHQFQSQKEEIISGHIRQVRNKWDHSHDYGKQKLMHWQSSVCWCTVPANQPVLVPLPLWIFSVDLLTQMLQIPLPVMLNTVWPGGTNSWSAMPSAHTVKYHHQHALYVQSWFSWFFQMRREWAFQLKWWFLGHNSKPRFNLKMELWSLLMYQAVPDIQMHVILLVVHEQSRNKPNGDPPQTEVPPYNLPACSTFHTRYLTCQWTSEMVLC